MSPVHASILLAIIIIQVRSNHSTSILNFAHISYDTDRYPIILDNWYDGVWFDKNNAYIVYPAGFQVVKVGGVSYVMVSFSLQDRRGYMGHIRLDTLMASLMPVNCSQSIAETEVENNVTVTSY